MKAIIIILLLLSCNLKAQDTNYWIYYEESNYDTIMPTTPRYDPVLELLFEYKAYCYNDSTWTHTYNPKWYDHECYEQKGNLAQGYYFVLSCKDSSHFEWVHRTPTLDDFFDWLYKSYNIKL